MPSYLEAVVTQTQDVEVEIGGVKYRATKSLARGDKDEADAQIADAKYNLAYRAVQRTIAREKLDGEDHTEEQTARLLEIWTQFGDQFGDYEPQNERWNVCSLISKYIVKWNVEDEKGVTIELGPTDLAERTKADIEGLYASKPPTTFLRAFWTKTENAEMAPKAKRSSSKSG